MFIDNSPNHPDDSQEFFIGENLSSYQAEWLWTQSEALGQTGGQMLEAILKEWLFDHPQETMLKLDQGGIARRAMNEFIVRHHKEFLPLSCIR
ncbi:MAG: hypothetical protein JOZ08_14950 [Verrucomicrobia bacterium]|nr:hypothetical protein [Verrucomicrobiota bacterium]MBV8276334.1 hypothetical protein [Verrucomicrobiota bacterium]